MIIPHQDRWPDIHETAFIAPSADIVGDTQIGADSSIWFQCVVRGDVNSIRIGSRTNIQDLTVIHVTRKSASCTVGDEVTVGHRALLHGCTIGDRCLIGMGAILMDHSEIGEDSMVAAGAIVTEGKKFLPRSLILGAPARRIRELTAAEIAFLKQSAENYVQDARVYRASVRNARRMGVARDSLDWETDEL